MKPSNLQNHTLFTTSTLSGAERYWFGFQGQEAENEIWGEGNASFYKYRISDNRLGRFFSVDPLAAQYPHNSTYAFSENRVIDGVELEGLEVFSIHGNARISAILTISCASGIMFDSEGIAGFITPSFGLGIIGGASLGGGLSYSSATRIEDLDAWGGSIGMTFKTPIGGAEVSGDFSSNDKNGATSSIGTGGELGFYGEATYSFIGQKISYGDLAKSLGSNAWRKVKVATSKTFNAITYNVQNSQFYAVGNNHIKCNIEPNQICTLVYVQNSKDLYDVYSSSNRLYDAGYMFVSPSSLPTGYTNMSMFAIDGIDNNVVAVGSAGTILQYTGTVWDAPSQTIPQIQSVASAGGVLYAVGNTGTVLRSANNGSSWNMIQLSSELQAISFYAIDFANASVGIIGGTTGTLAYTVNGGATFIKSNVPSSILGTIIDIKMFSPSQAIAITNTQQVLATSDGGVSWISASVSDEVLACAAYPAENCMFVAGKNGVHKVTFINNQELDISKIGGSEDNMNITSLMFNSCLYGYAFASDGSIYKTEQGNQLVKQNDMSAQSEIVAVAPLSSNSFVLLGNNAEISFTEDNNGLYSSKFWYDELGRLIASQNSKQFLQNTYSYTVYDEIGRIIEVGELASEIHPPYNSSLTSQIDYTEFGNWIANATSRTQVTKTTYDHVLQGFAIADFEQRNLRNRVASVQYFPDVSQSYSHATHYTYDIHGNVNTMIQDIPALAEQRYKRLDYTYDLVSNVVRQVVYQKGEADQFAHRYEYDDDNRIVAVETSTDPQLLLWNREAEYKYYRHGPLAQTVIGDGLQTMDYYYTLQGWIKGVNDPLLRTNPDKKIQDVFGYSLHYFEGDYTPISEDVANNLVPVPTQDLQQTAGNLYNGNIRSMITGIAGLENPTQAMTYQYDQLNRISSSVSHGWDNQSNSFTAHNLYNTKYTYDANGNISTLKRNAPQSATNSEPTLMDNLTYSYFTKNEGFNRNTNRLASVSDSIAGSLYDDEFKSGQAENNYSYDAIGNLIADAQEEIEEIHWNVSGKVVYLKRTENSDKPDLQFEYDAMGNRIAKHVIHSEHTLSTFYVRDAEGTIMATYTKTNETELALEEQPIYGSSRLGVYRPTAETGIMRGARTYEATNHLGNVLATYTDRIIANEEDSLYTVDISSATDFYPFGTPMYGRSFSSNSYKFGFNSQEKEDEIYGEGNTYSAEYWMYDARLGRRWNIDPVDQISISNYATFANNPIKYIDHNGAEWEDENAKQQADDSREATKNKISDLQNEIQTIQSTGSDITGTVLTAEQQSQSVNELNARITELKNHLTRLDNLEQCTEYKYGFRNISGNIGETSLPDKNNLVLASLNLDDQGLFIHEVLHMEDIRIGRLRTRDDYFNYQLEIDAYNAQIAYDGFITFIIQGDIVPLNKNSFTRRNTPTTVTFGKVTASHIHFAMEEEIGTKFLYPHFHYWNNPSPGLNLIDNINRNIRDTGFTGLEPFFQK